MSRRQKAKGFTLVELLVVISIIGMLASLLVPAITSARESGRKSVCMNSCKNLGTAMVSFHESKRSFPGYVNNVMGKRASWNVMMLPYLERSDLWTVWQNEPYVEVQSLQSGTMTASGGKNPCPFVKLELYVCPSNAASGGDPLSNPNSYVVNSGHAIGANDNNNNTCTVPERRDAGVCFNQSHADYGSGQPVPFVRNDVDFISNHDGTVNTILLTENLQAMNWVTDPISNKPVFGSDFQARQSCAFVWFVLGTANNTDNGAQGGNFNLAAIKINAQGRLASNPVEHSFNPSGSTAGGSGGLAHARPSCMHNNGANFMFCDNHYRFISEDIPYHVFTQLCTPNQINLKDLINPSNYVLSDGDY